MSIIDIELITLHLCCNFYFMKLDPANLKKYKYIKHITLYLFLGIIMHNVLSRENHT